MKLQVVRFSSRKDSTNGLLFDVTDGVRFLSYTLEDEHRDVKVAGETRVPAGTYQITLRTVGGFHARYLDRYQEFHKGMLWVRDVPGFEYILIHAGNTDEHTAGCLLVGNTQKINFGKGNTNGYVGQSRKAYERIYGPIAKALEDGEEVTIEYIDADTPIT